MNVFLQYIKCHIKSFLIWALSCSVLILSSMTKYEGLKGSGSAEIIKLMDRFPKILLAMFGMVGLQVDRVADYYSVIGFLVMIVISIYAIRLGSDASSDEIADHTAEFLYTRPRKRSIILLAKVKAGVLILTLIALVSGFVSHQSVRLIVPDSDINWLIVNYTIAIWLVGLVFLGITFLLGTCIKSPESSSSVANKLFLVVFGTGIAFDMLEDAQFLRWVSPLRYFTGSEMVSGDLSPVFTALSLAILIMSVTMGLFFFSRRDISV